MATTTTAPTQQLGALDRYFKITERGSTIGAEVRGGLVTFFTMAYILVLNPIILGGVPDGTGNFLADGDGSQIAAVTALVAGVMTILMGVVANFPLALAAGMGLNAVVAFSIATIPGMTWADAMGIIVIEGLIILILVLTGFREAVFRAVPHELKVAISVGIGLFIAFIGFVDSGFVRSGAGTPVQLGIDGSLGSWPILVFVVGLLAAIILTIKKVRGAILVAIIGSTVLAIIVEAIGSIGAQGADGSNPGGWALTVPQLTDGWGLPTFGSWVTSRCSARSATSASSPSSCWCSPSCWPTSSTPWAPWWPWAARPGCWRRTATRRRPARSSSSTRSPPQPVAWAPSRRTRRTSSRRPAWATAPARAWRPW